jgi:starch phosphorylase
VDGADAEALYRLLEQEIAPEFYDRDASGLPRAWLARIRRSMIELTAAYSSGRMAQEYLETAYLPAVAAMRRRTEDGAAGAKALRDWAERLRRSWAGLHIGPSAFAGVDGGWRVSTPILLGELGCQDVRVEAYAEAKAGGEVEIVALAPGPPIPGTAHGYIYAGAIPTSRPAADYTVRVVPVAAEAILPLEAPLIAWER